MKTTRLFAFVAIALAPWALFAQGGGVVVAGGPGAHINAQTISYTMLSSDCGNKVHMSGTNLTFTLASPPPSGTCPFDVLNLDLSPLTVARNGLTINGKAQNITLENNERITVWTDGTNYFADGPFTTANDAFNSFVETDNFCAFDGATRLGTHMWTVGGTGGALNTANGFVTYGPNYPCALRLTSGATSGNWGSAGPMSASANIPTSYLIGADMYFVFHLEQHAGAPQQSMRIGVMGTNVSGDPTNFIGLRSVETVAGANWFFVCRSAGVDGTATDTTIPVDTSTHKFRIRFTSATNYTMALDAGTPVVVNTGCPASFSSYPAYKIDTSENVTKALDLLFWKWTNFGAR